jgi:hypothetical protein
MEGLPIPSYQELRTLSQASSEVVGVVTEKEIRSYKSERMQRITIYSEQDNRPHLQAERLAETTEQGGHVERCHKL